MDLEVDVAGRARRVSITRTGDLYEVVVDGTLLRVDAARVGLYTWSLIVAEADARRASREITVSPDAATGQTAVRIGPERLILGVNGRRRFGARASAGSSSGPQRLLAPMPGKIVRVLVKPGETVHARQPLVVVEAMKMENELRAARDGSVAEVHVAEGASVDAGTLLVIVQ